MARALVSKTRCCGFESHRACHFISLPEGRAPCFPPLGSRFFVIEGYKTVMIIKKLIKFLREVKLEMKKVSWPSRAEISGSTGVVIVTVLIVAVYLGIIDAILQQAMLLLH